MRLFRHAALITLVPALLSCSGSLPPFETVPPAPRAGEDANATRVAVCYNTLTTSAEDVLAIASRSCGVGAKPRAVEHDYSLDNCPLLQPGRATFVCSGS